MALEVGGEVEHLGVVHQRPPPATSDRARAMPATIAAEEDPRPRLCGMTLRQREPQTRRLRAHRVERGAHRPDHQVGLVAGYGVGPLAVDLDRESVGDHLRLELVAEPEGQAEGVVAGAEVGRWWRARETCTGPSTNRAIRSSPAAAAAASTSASTMLSTRWPKPSSAVAVSLSPWPVTVTATVAPAYESPSSRSWSRPATPAAEAGSTKTPSRAGQLALGGHDLVVGQRPNRPPDSAAAASASFQEAGLPIRIAVAMVSGCGNGSPVTSGAAPSAW